MSFESCTLESIVG